MLAYLGLSLLLLGVGSKLYVHMMGMLKKPCKDPLAAVEVLDMTVSEDQVQGCLVFSASCANMLAAKVKSLLLLENPLDTAKFALLLYTATFLGAFMNMNTLVILAWTGAFSLPTLYKAKQQEVDSLLEVVQAQYSALNSKLVAMIPASAPAPAPAPAKEE